MRQNGLVGKILHHYNAHQYKVETVPDTVYFYIVECLRKENEDNALNGGVFGRYDHEDTKYQNHYRRRDFEIIEVKKIVDEEYKEAFI